MPLSHNLSIEISKYSPIDSTTNPSLILKAAQLPKYASLVRKTLKETNGNIKEAMDALLVSFGLEILNVIPGRLSVEVDAHLSADTEATVQKALKLIALFARAGISKERILIKIAATWEGIQAARILESSHGVHCNLTLIFNFTQAIACANAKVTLISPFVGRILDWWVKQSGKTFTPSNDPGVEFVKSVFYHFKCFGISTEIMGASFRSIEEIIELVGLDCITISPVLLERLASSEEKISRKLFVEDAKAQCSSKASLVVESKEKFDELLSQDPVVNALLPEGISRFCQDAEQLESFLREFQ